MSSISASQAALGDLLALPVGERAEQHARRRRAGPRGRWPGRALRTARRTDSRAAPARAGRRRAACRARAPAAPARAPWRRARRPGARRTPRRPPRGPSQSPASTSPPRGRRAKRHGGPSANSSPSGVSASRTTSAQLGVGARRARRCRPARPRARAPLERDLGGAARGAATSGSPSASSRRRSGSRSSYSRNTSRTRERSGSRTASAATSKSTATSRCTVASCLDTRASSACSMQVLFALGAFDLVDVREHVLERAVASGSARWRSCRRSRGRRGCCRRCRPSARRSRGSARARCRSGRSPPGGRRSSSR